MTTKNSYLRENESTGCDNPSLTWSMFMLRSPFPCPTNIRALYLYLFVPHFYYTTLHYPQGEDPGFFLRGAAPLRNSVTNW